MKKVILIMTLCVSGFYIKAQDGNEKGERIQALKIAFITQKLQLTSDEAQKFWPVYNQYESEIRQTVQNDRNSGDAIANEEKVLQIKKKYRPEFTRVIGTSKANNFFNTEKEFRGALMRNLKNRQGPRQMKLRRK